MKTTLFVFAALFFLVHSSPASDQIPGKPQDHPIAITNVTIHPVSGPVIERGTVLFDHGKIVALGKVATFPPATEIIDATDKHVYPGLISPDTYVGLTEIGAVRASNDYSEAGRINPNVRAEVAFHPESEIIPVTRANGILTVATAPRGGVISGTGAVMMMDGWTWEEMTLKAPSALYVNWPDMNIARGPRVQQSEEEQKKAREKNINELSEAFADARAYMTAKKAESKEGISYHDVDARWEAMIPVLEGKVPVVVWAYDMQQIQAAVGWADKEGVRLIIAGGYDAWRVADLLKRKHIPVLAGGTHRMPVRRFEPYDEPFVLPKKLFDAGIRFAIISQDEAAHERSLPYQAARAAAYGLPKEEALKALTLYPAQIFGVADRIGSLEAGKDATLMITNGDPLEVICNIEQAYIQGRRVDLSSRHTMLYEKYKEKYKRKKG